MYLLRKSSSLKVIIIVLALLLALEGAIYGGAVEYEEMDAHAALPSIEMQPTEDTYADGVSPDQNFGNAIRTIIRDVPGNLNDKIAYYKFDLSEVAIRADRALLRLYVNEIAPEILATNVSAYAVSDNNWDESSLTWNNKPLLDEKLSSTTAYGPNQWIELDVTSHVKAGLEDTAIVTIAVLDDNQNNRAVRMYSKESSDYKPVLRIQQEPPYIMGSIPADGERHINITSSQISLEFDRPMDTSTMHSSSILLLEGPEETVVPYTNFSGEAANYTISLPHNLKFSTLYKVRVSSDTVKDVEGTPLSNDQEIVFTTMPEASDDYTVTRYTPWMVNLHLTTMDAVAQGIKGGDGAQRIWSYGIDPSDSDHVMLGTDTTGLYRSEDGGHSYEISGEGLEIIGTIDIAISPDDSDVAYVAATAGKESDKTNVSVHSGIWKTTDRGKTWRHVLHAPYYRYPSGYMIRFGAIDEPTLSRPIYIATHQEGIFKSEDEGNSWSYLGLSGNTIGDFYLSPDDGTLIAASLENGIMASYDDGASWLPRNDGFHSTDAYGITVHPDNSDFWIAAVDNLAYKSENAGVTWNALPRPNGFSIERKIRKVLFGASTGTAQPPRLYVVGENVAFNIRFSTDLGMNWNRPIIDNSIGFTQGITGYAPDALKPDYQDPDVIWATFNSNPFKSIDGGQTFVNAASGYSGHRASDFLFDETDDQNIFIAFIDRGIAKSVKPEKNGVYPMFMDLTHDESIRYEGAKTAHSIARNPNNPEHLIFNVGHWNTHTILAQTFDNGLTMQHIPGTAGNNIKLIEFHPQNPQIIYAGTRYSENAGVSWQIRDKNVIAVSQLDGDHVWAVERSDDYFTLYESWDRGFTWSANAFFNETNTIPIRSVTADLGDADVYWVATNYGIYKFDGQTVTAIDDRHGLVPDVDGGLEIFSIAQNPNNHQHYVAGGYNTNLGPTAGLFESRDGGNNWHLVPGMKGVRDIWKVEFHPALPQVYAATSHGTWVYEYNHFVDPARFNLLPTDDAAANSALPDSSNGASASIIVQNESSELNESIVYLKFQLQQITGNIESASLNVYNHQMNPMEPSFMLDAFSTETNWAEGTLSWNNRPQLLSPLTSVSASGTQMWERFDVTEYVTEQLLHNQEVSFAIRDLSESGKAVAFHTKEASVNRPFLEIITTQNNVDDQGAGDPNPIVNVPTLPQQDNKAASGLHSISADGVQQSVDWEQSEEDEHLYRIAIAQAEDLKLRIEAEAIQQLTALNNNAVLRIANNLASYDLPLALLHDLQRESTSFEYFMVEIKLLDMERQTQFKEDFMQKGLQMLGSAIEFKLTVWEEGGESRSIEAYDGYVTRAIAIEHELDPERSTVMWLNHDSEIWSPVPTVIQGQENEQMASFQRMGNSVYALVQGNVRFVDMDKHWAQASVESLAAKQLVFGRNHNQFLPASPISRAEFTVLLDRALALHRKGTGTFTDVQAEAWYADSVGRAVEAELVSGFTDGSFRPNQTITRQEMALMVYRTLLFVSIDLPAVSEKQKFQDEEEIAVWALRAVQMMLSLDIMKGTEAGKFNPHKTATRAEAVMAVSRLLKTIGFAN